MIEHMQMIGRIGIVGVTLQYVVLHPGMHFINIKFQVRSYKTDVLFFNN